MGIQPFCIRALGEIVLRVRDLNAMQKFYEQIIGLELMRRFENDAVFFRIGLLAYNLSMAMKLLVFPKAYQTRQISTIRWRVYEWAGYLVKHAGKLALRVSASVEFIRFFSMCRHRCWLLSTG